MIQRRSNETIHIIAFVSITLVLLSEASAIQQQQQLQEDGQEESEPPNLVNQQVTNYYQPALIGFRCETVRDVTSDGVSVIEANTPVTLTLYGNSFTGNTIVAFTTEFYPDMLDTHSGLSTHFIDETNSQPLVASNTIINSNSNNILATEYESTATTTTSTAPTTVNAFANSSGSGSQALAISGSATTDTNSKATNQRFARRRTKSKSYDCTDYNRVTSYRLTDDNILSPNVAVLTITLPELDSSSGMYYYFCLKQPQLSVSSNGQRSLASNVSLVWVHQGDEWWVTLKVEPPILSIANDCVLILLLLFLSAVTSGLNLGLMSLDMNELAVISSCGDQRERSYARTIAPLRKRGNYLLCSLLLGNVMVNSTLTVILEEMTSGVVAVIGSTLAIVVLGEIVPQAFCARQGLAIGAKTIYLTYAFMLLTFPLSYPISCLLDCVLGEEKGNVYDRERLMEFIKITGHHTQLEADEVAIISGALKLKKIKVDQIMTRIEDVFMLPIDCKLDRDTIRRIIEKGYSRIPVYEFDDRKQIVALILAKDLALLDPDDHTPIANMLMYCKHPLIYIDDDTTLDVALNEFKTGKSHMAVVRQIYDDGDYDKYYEAIGVVTLEDVIEEVLQVEINDETDTLSDNRRKRRRTDAQVAHHIDELASVANSNSTTARLDCELGAGHYHEPSLSNKLVQTSLSSHLTSVSVGGLARSLAMTPSKQQPAAPPQMATRSARVATALASTDPGPSSKDPNNPLPYHHHHLPSQQQPQKQQLGQRSSRSMSVELPASSPKHQRSASTGKPSSSSNATSQRSQASQQQQQLQESGQQQLAMRSLQSQAHPLEPEATGSSEATSMISRAAHFLSNIIK